ncbi:UDP-N-acetylmuramoyl-L-alanyl-D-glutamate--2,6-diaminopimelate ligase [bacterium]|nr:UDP-N-acetylmuramoyl-L-alanyl-D-glutamate--2,6-diaminopimelate ligase [bacterium]
MLTLGRLTRLLDLNVLPENDPETLVSVVTADSREVKPGAVFVALKGQKADGHAFIPQAIDAGALLIINAEQHDPTAPVPLIRVDRPRYWLGMLAAEYYDHPSRHMDLIGVTGTNGKTTTTYFLRSILNCAGLKTELIGTTGFTREDMIVKLDRTTPEAPDLQKILAEFRTSGVQGVVMEVSSHAVVFERIAGCSFRGGIFTNITEREHLDFHKNFTHYRQAKQAFFKEYISSDSDSFACLNADDPNVDFFLGACGHRTTLYSKQSCAGATVLARNLKPGLFGISFDLIINNQTLPVTIHLTGPYNVENALAAAAAASNLGLELSQIKVGLEQLEHVPGRFELISAGQDFAVVVDYAHTDDALYNLLSAARACQPNRLITVFGCGGDRDTSKRPRMGQSAAELSDLVIITSDNPRSEDPLAIISQIKAGIPDSTRVKTIPDRREAIDTAIQAARTGDMVVIAGKGHEDYQIFADRTIHFDDRAEARRALQNRC